MAGLGTPSQNPGSGDGGGSSSITSLLGITSSGQKTMSGSLSVAIASDNTGPVELWDGTNIANVLKSDGTSAGQNSQLVGNAGQTQAYSTGTGGAQAAFLVQGYASIAVQVETALSGGSTGFQVSNDNTNWNNLELSTTDIGDASNSPGNTQRIYAGNLYGVKYFRLNLSGSGGTASGTIQFSTLPITPPITSVSLNSNGQQGTPTVGVSDGTNTANILKSDGTAAGQNAQLVAGTFLEKTASVTSATTMIAATDVSNYKWWSLQVQGMGTAVVVWEGSNDNSNWYSIYAFQVGSASAYFANATNANGIFIAPIHYRYLRVRTSSYGSGTIVGTLELYTSNSFFGVTEANQQGSWTVGSNSATGSAVPANAFYEGGQAINAEVTARSNGNLGGFITDLVGKLITMPFANKENLVSGIATATGTSDTAVIAAQGSGLYIYITSISVVNTGATSVLVTIETDTASAKTAIWYMIAPAGGGQSFTFTTPIRGSVTNKNIGFVAGGSTTTLQVSIAGYAGT